MRLLRLEVYFDKVMEAISSSNEIRDRVIDLISEDIKLCSDIVSEARRKNQGKN